MRRAITALTLGDATRAHRRANKERLKLLKDNLRRALAERKARMKDFASLARTERLAVRAQLSEAHSLALRDLTVKMRAARAAAKVAHVARMAQVKHIYDSAVASARAALEAERLHQAEHVRISKEEERQRGEIHKAHERVLAATPAVHTSAALGTFGPLFDKIGPKVKPNPGESKTEALLRHVEAHPDEAHAVLEPAKEQAIAKTRAEIAAVERGASMTPGAKPQLSLVKGTLGGTIASANTFGARALPSPRALTPSASPLPEKKVTPSAPAVSLEDKVKAPDEHDTAKLAKLIRADIQSAVNAGRLPKKAKYSVTTSKYSMGSSITVVVSKLPFRVLNPAAYRVQKGSIYAEFDRTFPSRYTPEAEKLLADINAIIDAYHWNRSDPMTDYYNERFARDVKFGDSHKEWEAIDAAKRAGDDSLLLAPAKIVETPKKVEPPTKSPAKAPSPIAKEKQRRKGELPRSGGGVLLSDLLQERAELAAAKAARLAAPPKRGAPRAPLPARTKADKAPGKSRTETSRTLVLGRAEDDFEVVREGRRDLGERPETRPARVPKVLVWKNAVAKEDVEAERAKAEAFASKEGWTVFEYAASEKDPLARAKRDVLRQDRPRSAPKARTSASKPSPAAQETGWNRVAGYQERVLCSRCGCKGTQHRAIDGKCPATSAWGRVQPDPLSNWALEGEVLDAALAAFWSANPTFYRPVTARGDDDVTAPAAPNAYEAKRAARVERMKSKASKLRAEAHGAFAREHAVGDRIPMGQPILVGHHSEKKHRRDIKKMDALARKGIALSKAAATMERRASSAEKNRAIFSDDPEALPKLRAQLATMETNRARMRAANAAIRAGGDAVAALRAQGFSEKTARALTEKDAMGHVGFPPYKFQNAGTEYTRIKKRITELEARASSPARPSETIGEVTLSEADNRVRVVFPGKPPEATRTALKESGFRWAPSLGVWQRHASVGAWSEARRIAAHHGASSKPTS